MFLILLLSTTLANGQSPLAVAQSICDRYVSDSETNLSKVPASFRQSGIWIFDLSLQNGKEFTLVTSAKFSPKNPSNPFMDQPHLALSFDPGYIEVFLDKKLIVSATEKSPVDFQLLDYDLGDFRYMLPIRMQREGQLVIRYKPSTNRKKIYLGLTNSKKLNWPKSKVYWDEELPYVYTDQILDLAKIHSYDEWKIPGNQLVYELESPLGIDDWRYFTGTAFDAMDQVTATFESLDYSYFVEDHLQFYKESLPKIEMERNRIGNVHSVFGHYFRYKLLDDFGMQTVPFLSRLSKTGNRAFADKALDQILTKSPKTKDGVWARLNTDSLTVWADDLFMGSVLLTRASKILNKPAYLEESIHQVIGMDKILKDETSGLYWHGHFQSTDQHSSSKWARANGWTMMAKTELLLHLPKKHRKRKEVLKIFRSHAHALLKVQSEDGRWHQVLDNPSTYLETSSTAMFIRAFAEGIRNGWLPEKAFGPALEKAWNSLLTQIDGKGKVKGIVKGTPILFSDQEYNNQKTRKSDPRGLGAILYACVAMELLDRSQ